MTNLDFQSPQSHIKIKLSLINTVLVEVLEVC